MPNLKPTCRTCVWYRSRQLPGAALSFVCMIDPPRPFSTALIHPTEGIRWASISVWPDPGPEDGCSRHTPEVVLQ